MVDIIESEKQLKGFKVLLLNLNSEPFEVMVTGEKNEEYRDIKKWTNSRILNKDGGFRAYDYVKFVEGYGGAKPFFYCKFKGTKRVSKVHKKYSNGLEVNFDDERYAIMLGDIVLTRNLK